jgi:hypothetical protein
MNLIQLKDYVKRYDQKGIAMNENALIAALRKKYKSPRDVLRKLGLDEEFSSHYEEREFPVSRKADKANEYSGNTKDSKMRTRHFDRARRFGLDDLVIWNRKNLRNCLSI